MMMREGSGAARRGALGRVAAVRPRTLVVTAAKAALAAGPVPTKDVHGLDSADHRALRETVRKFVEAEINPHVEAWEREGRFPAKQLFKRAGEVGLLGLSKDERWGGSGLDFSFEIVLGEELGWARHGATPMALGVQTNMATPALARFGSDYVKETFLAPTIRGDMVACLGVSEAGAGSDVASLRTRAVRDGSDLVINGSKMWTTNALQADWMCLLCNTETSGGPHRDKSLVCVPMKTPGISFAKVIDKMGMRASDTAAVSFDNVRVPQANIIGKPGEGFTLQMRQFQEERLYVAATTLRALELCINETAEYARHRQLFGAALLDNQSVHFRLGEMQTEIEALRALIYRATERYVERGEDVTELASMAKLKAGRLCRTVTDGCLQLWGGMGFTNEVVVSRMYRDMRLTSIGGGADEVCLNIISKLKGWLPKRASGKAPAAAQPGEGAKATKPKGAG